ncbi:MAG: hypothetical protein JJU11_08960 [Candidatus Sumerlaeia bacterium]|nr:hypothetical protein [Candidatus Sumerlaeia bacterium]
MHLIDMISFPGSSMALGLVDVAFILLVFIVLCCLGWLAWRAIRGVTELGSMEQEAEMGFEEQLLQELKIAPDLPTQHKSPIIQGRPEPSQHPPPPPAVPSPREPAPTASQGSKLVRPSEIATRLQALKIVNSREGKVSLPIPPDGEIYGLIRGGSCLVLPRQESEALMHYFVRRFDLVIFPGPDGDLVVVERFQNRLPSLLDDEKT